MIELEGAALAPPPVTYPDMIVLAHPEGQILLASIYSALPPVSAGDFVLEEAEGDAGDE